MNLIYIQYYSINKYMGIITPDSSVNNLNRHIKHNNDNWK